MVLMIVSVVSIIALPQFLDFSRDAKTAVTNEKLMVIKQAIIGDGRIVSEGRVVAAGFISNVGSVPTALTNLTTQGAFANYDPFTKIGWRGPYVNSTDVNWNKDAWGTLLEYSQAGRYIRSCGPNLTCGNADDITVSF